MITYFTGTTSNGVALAGTSDDDIYTLTKKALDIEFFPSVEVAAEALPARRGNMPSKYILISLNNTELEYVNTAPLFTVDYIDIIVVSESRTEIESLEKRIRNALLRCNYFVIGNAEPAKCDDTRYTARSTEYGFRRGVNNA